MRLAHRIVLAFCILLLAGAFLAWEMSRLAPPWYDPPDPASPTVKALAEQIEYGVVEHAQRVRPPEQNHWTLRLTQTQINSWLSARLPQWVAHRGGDWPADIGPPQINLTDEGISVAVPLDDEGGDGSGGRPIVARIRPTVTDAGLMITVDRVWIGRLTLPGEPLANLLEEIADAAPAVVDDPNVRAVMDVISQKRPIDPVFELSDGRRVRVRQIKHGDGWIDITSVTLD